MCGWMVGWMDGLVPGKSLSLYVFICVVGSMLYVYEEPLKPLQSAEVCAPPSSSLPQIKNYRLGWQAGQGPLSTAERHCAPMVAWHSFLSWDWHLLTRAQEQRCSQLFSCFLSFSATEAIKLSSSQRWPLDSHARRLWDPTDGCLSHLGKLSSDMTLRFATAKETQ